MATVAKRPEQRLMPEIGPRGRLWRLHTRISVEQGTSVLFLEGRLGQAAAAQLERVAAPLAAAEPSCLVIDLSGVDYLSSAALKVFEGLAAQSPPDRRLVLRSPSVAARLALELSGLLSLVDSG